MLLACLCACSWHACAHVSGGRAPMSSLGLGMADVAQVPHSDLLLSQVYPKTIPNLSENYTPKLSQISPVQRTPRMLLARSWRASGLLGRLRPHLFSPYQQRMSTVRKLFFRDRSVPNPLNTELRELSAVTGSKPAKVCAPRISFFGIYVRN